MKQSKTWKVEKIAARLEEAANVMKRLPAVKVQGYASTWPEMLYSEMEKLQMELKSEPIPVSPEQIARMEETCRWLLLVPNIDDRRLLWLRAERIRWRLICAKLGMARATADRRWKNALRMISLKLP